MVAGGLEVAVQLGRSGALGGEDGDASAESVGGREDEGLLGYGEEDDSASGGGRR